MQSNTSDTSQRILDAVDAGFDAQLATTTDFVAIPSTRGAEGPCQDMIGDLLRRRGYEVDDWHIDVNDLKDLRGFGPIEHDFSRARTVVGTYRPSSNGGKSLILQGHYVTERPAVVSLADVLQQRFADSMVTASRRESDPVEFV